MKSGLISQIELLNPWLKNLNIPIFDEKGYVARLQESLLCQSEWDKKWLILTGPRQAGKTTLGKYISQQMIKAKRFHSLLYLNCDLFDIREWLKSSLFIREAIDYFDLEKPIIFIDEVQRLENPGLLLKSIADLKLPIKMIASGSSQLEIKSKVQEHLTGRQFESIVLPFSCQEINHRIDYKNLLIYGCYPDVVFSSRKSLVLSQLYMNYLQKDVVEILRMGDPDVMQRLIVLLAHASGQLLNYNQLSTDCRINYKKLENYLSVLEQTYVIARIRPFVGNKRTEITSNPICYFIDNGFRNQALRNFNEIEARTDAGLLVESAIFQEILKYKTQHFLDFDIHYWRTKSGAEVDFVLYQNDDHFVPVEVKFQNLQLPKITRSYRSFLEAYRPEKGVVITKNLLADIKIENSTIYFIPLDQLDKLFVILGGFF